MIAYFALLSFVPLLFLALAGLGFAGRADESSFLVQELNKAFPSSSVDSILRWSARSGQCRDTRGDRRHLRRLDVPVAVQRARVAFNIVYGKPNRSFLHGKLIAVTLLVGSLVTLFVG